MMTDREAFARHINSNPRDRTSQLVYADWLDERGESKKARFFRGGLVGRGGLIGRFGLGGRVGLGGLVGHVGLGGRGGLIGLGGLGGRGGRGGLIGRGGLGGLVGLIFKPEAKVMLIEGESALIFMPHGYGFSVLVGHVAQELAQGWIVDPCREIIDTRNGDCWVELASGNKEMRRACQYGVPIVSGARVPYGVFSLLWIGDLPE